MKYRKTTAATTTTSAAFFCCIHRGNETKASVVLKINLGSHKNAIKKRCFFCWYYPLTYRHRHTHILTHTHTNTDIHTDVYRYTQILQTVKGFYACTMKSSLMRCDATDMYGCKCIYVWVWVWLCVPASVRVRYVPYGSSPLRIVSLSNYDFSCQ